jgi:hypothetical protein
MKLVRYKKRNDLIVIAGDDAGMVCTDGFWMLIKYEKIHYWWDGYDASIVLEMLLRAEGFNASQIDSILTCMENWDLVINE